MTLVIGLTGGIGSGKSSAARIFASLGAGVVDTDEIAHRLTARGQPALAEIAAQLGVDCIGPEGDLDREKLRQLVFSRKEARERLEAILHPLIRQQVEAELQRIDTPYVVVVVPLLLEKGGYRELVDRVLVVDCEEAQQVARAAARSRLAPDEVKAIMAAQLPREERLRQADDVLPNRGGPEELEQRVRALHDRYMQLAAAKAVAVKAPVPPDR
jgi:dephospho-CoA kinase